MYDKLKVGFWVAGTITALAGLVTIVGRAFIGYAMQAAMLPSCIALCCLTAVIGLITTAAAPKGERLNVAAPVVLWVMYGVIMIGHYTHPSDELREAMEARSK